MNEGEHSEWQLDATTEGIPEPEGQGGTCPPDFDKSVNTISTPEVDYTHHITNRPYPQISRPSDIPSTKRKLSAKAKLSAYLVKNYNALSIPVI